MMIFFLNFPTNRLWHFMQTVCSGDNLSEMPKPIFWKKKKKKKQQQKKNKQKKKINKKKHKKNSLKCAHFTQYTKRYLTDLMPYQWSLEMINSGRKCHHNMGCVMRKPVFRHIRTAKAQIRLRGCAVWSGPSLSANRTIGYYRMYE